MQKENVWVESFNTEIPVTIVIENEDIVIGYGRNPHGSHNLVGIIDGEVHAHGNAGTLSWIKWIYRFNPTASRKIYRETVNFLSRKKTIGEMKNILD